VAKVDPYGGTHYSEVAQVVGDHAQPKSYLVRPRAVAAQPRHPHRLLALFDPLLRRAALVVETHHALAARLQVGHDESDSGEQFPEVEISLRHYPPREYWRWRKPKTYLFPSRNPRRGPEQPNSDKALWIACQ
jgi:hypothetical protein